MKYFRDTLGAAIQLPAPLFGSRPLLPEESRSIRHFQTVTVPAMSGFFDQDLSSFWRALPFRLGQTEPVILHAIIALGAYHESMELVGNGDSWNIDDNTMVDSGAEFKLRQYAKAISLLRNNLSSTPPSAFVLEISCIIFACIEFLRNNHQSSLTHLSGAITSLISNQRRRFMGNEEKALKALLARVSLTQSLYGRPRGFTFPNLLNLDRRPAELQEDKFGSLNEARIANTNLLGSTMLVVRMSLFGCFKDPFTAVAAHRSLKNKLRNWSVNFENLMNHSPESMKDQRGPRLLRVHHILATIFLAVSETGQECMFDRYVSQFETILELLDLIMSHENCGKDSNLPSFSLDTGIIPPLFFTAIKCRHTKVRRKAISLLHRTTRKEGLWDAIEAAKVAEVVMNFEEQALVDDRTSEFARVPDWALVYDVDIHNREVSDSTRQLVILKYKPGGVGTEMLDIPAYIQW
jgi:hypothetical protein